MIKDKDIALFEELATQFQQVHQISPLAAKLYTYILLDVDQEGITFDEMVDFFGVSKSSISTSIQLLLQMKLVESCNKFNSRKRYFKINNHYLEFKLQNILDYVQKEKDLTLKYKAFKVANFTGEATTERLDIYLDHLRKISQHLKKTIDKLRAD